MGFIVFLFNTIFIFNNDKRNIARRYFKNRCILSIIYNDYATSSNNMWRYIRKEKKYCNRKCIGITICSNTNDGSRKNWVIYCKYYLGIWICTKKYSRNKFALWFNIYKRRRRFIFSDKWKRSDRLLCFRWNSFFSSRVFICNKRIFANVYVLRFYINCNNYIIWV